MLLLLCVCLTLPSAVCAAPETLSKVGSGCQLYDGGRCAQSPNYPNSYGHSEACVLQVHATGTLVFDSFDTERNYDVLTVGDERLSGDLGPNTFDVAIGTTIEWTSDGWIQKKGWDLCVNPIIPWTVSSNVGPACQLEGNRRCVHSANFPHSYGPDQQCVLHVKDMGSLVIDPFHTETYLDYLEIKDVKFEPVRLSGEVASMVVTVSASTAIEWTSDGSVEQTGWRMCWEPLTPWTVVNSSDPESFVWGRCVYSPYFPNNYSRNEHSFFRVGEAGTLVMDPFDTQSGYDYLMVGDASFSGSGRRAVDVTPGTIIEWSSDDSDERNGWAMCLEPSSPWIVESSVGTGCQTQGRCAESANFPSSYGPNETCVLRVNASGSLVIDAFQTEMWFDYLMVGKARFSGDDASRPLTVTPLTTITWTSDGAVEQKGWRMCLEPATAGLLESFFGAGTMAFATPSGFVLVLLVGLSVLVLSMLCGFALLCSEGSRVRDTTPSDYLQIDGDM